MGKVPTDYIPGFSFVQASEDLVGGHVNNIGVVTAEDQGCPPVPTVGCLADVMAWSDPGALLFIQLQSEIISKLKARVHQVTVSRIGSDEHAIAAEDRLPMGRLIRHRLT